VKEFGDQILDGLIDGKKKTSPISGMIEELIQFHIRDRDKMYCIKMIQDANLGKDLRLECLKVIFNMPTRLD
jgi:hypothetical protein